MRKTLETICLIALAAQIWITWQALVGPEKLPDRIPFHFDAAGNPNGWGSPASLILVPAMAAGFYLLLTVIVLFPSTFNYPVEVTEENRPRLQALAQDMFAWLKAEIVCFFAWLGWGLIQAARHPGQVFAPTGVLVFLLVVFSTLGWYIVAMRRGSQAPMA
jgi:uncharacterized membrane protein